MVGASQAQFPERLSTLHYGRRGQSPLIAGAAMTCSDSRNEMAVSPGTISSSRFASCRSSQSIGALKCPQGLEAQQLL